VEGDVPHSDEADTEGRHGRLRWYLPEELDDEQREYYRRLTSGPRGKRVTDDRGRLRGAFNARLLDPEIGTAIQELAAALRFGGKLTDRTREIVVLEVARSERCSFAWLGHAALARSAGLTNEELDAIRRGVIAPTLPDGEQTARRVARHLIEHRDLSDDVFELAEQTIGLPWIFDIVTLVGHYQSTATALRVWRVPLDGRAEVVFE